jgi:catalase
VPGIEPANDPLMQARLFSVWDRALVRISAGASAAT